MAPVGAVCGECRSAAVGQIWPTSTPLRFAQRAPFAEALDEQGGVTTSPSGRRVATVSTRAASSASKSRPKWLRLSEGVVGKLRILEHGCDPRLLTAGKTTRGECLLGAVLVLLAAGVLRINDLFAQPLMHRDVVQVTEGVLQFLQSDHEILPSPHSLLAGKRAAKEL